MEGKLERTWFPFSDWANIVAMLAVAVFCLVGPLRTGMFGRSAKTTLAAAIVLMAFYPFSQAGHYRLFPARIQGRGKEVYPNGAPWMTDQEIVVSLVAVTLTVLAAFSVWHSN